MKTAEARILLSNLRRRAARQRARARVLRAALAKFERDVLADLRLVKKS